MPHEWVDLKDVLAEGRVRVKCRCGEYWSLHRGDDPYYSHLKHGKTEDPKDLATFTERHQAAKNVIQTLRDVLQTQGENDPFPFTVQVEFDVSKFVKSG